MSDDQIRVLIRKARLMDAPPIYESLEELLRLRAEIAQREIDRAALVRSRAAVIEMMGELRADRDAALEREMAAVKGRDAVVAEAVRVERERCADIASWHGGHAGNPAVWQYGDVIADAIRRGE